MKNKLGVALTKRACYICGKAQDAEIVMNQRLTEKNAENVEEMHGKVIGFTEEPCDECKEVYKDKIAFVEISEHEQGDDNPPRTGLVVGIKDEAVENIVGDKKVLAAVLKKRMSYILVNDLKLILGEFYPKKD